MSNCLFLGTADDKPYLPYLKGMFNGLSTYVLTSSLDYLTLLEQYCAKRQITRIVSTNTAILSKLLERIGNLKSNPSLADYQGSLFTFGPADSIEIVFVSPLRQLFTVSYGKFIASRFISKVTSPREWQEPTVFNWQVLTATNIDSFYADAKLALAIAVDIETFKNPLSIRCIGYTCVLRGNAGSIRTVSGVLPLDSLWALAWMRKLNDTEPAKIFQNGKYDNTYLLRYNAPCRNWVWDTAHQFHSYYSELPKDLAFLNAFFLRKVVYWKDLAETNDLYEYYKYNALDTWATANVWIGWILEAPSWARKNYTLEFPLVFPCLLAEMTGVKRDGAAHIKARSEVDAEEESLLNNLRKSVAAPGFNPASPLQVKSLLKVVGCSDIESSDEKSLSKASYRHPLIGRILTDVLDIRGLRKLRGTYLRTDDDAKQTGIHAGEGGAKEFNGRWLYALNPHGTDTGRLASKGHAFWCGESIQTIPRGPEVKQTLRAEDGFFLGECDLEQAESRDTAHIAGDLSLIAAVTGKRDFHSVNASAFFGLPYESIYDDELGKTKNKKLRDVAKRVNHGANYNMGPSVLVDTMGLKEIWAAKDLLKLPFTDPLEIAEYLLSVFHRTYPILRGHIYTRSAAVLIKLGAKQSTHKLFAPGTYYASVASEIAITKRLVSRAYHHTAYNLQHFGLEEYINEGDWTRYCFGDPSKNKLDLNSYVAHAPQSLNARTLNEAFMRVFYEVALPNPDTFRLHAQIHDSILFSYRDGHEYLADKVRECMEIPVSVRDVSGVVRTFTVPAALKLGKTQADGSFKRAKFWHETE